MSDTASDDRVYGYDNIVRVRAMLENMDEASDFTDGGDDLVSFARGDKKFGSGAAAGLLSNREFQYSLDAFTGDHRIWAIVPSWFLAQAICERGPQKTSGVLSVFALNFSAQGAPESSAFCQDH